MCSLGLPPSSTGDPSSIPSSSSPRLCRTFFPPIATRQLLANQVAFARKVSPSFLPREIEGRPTRSNKTTQITGLEQPRCPTLSNTKRFKKIPPHAAEYRAIRLHEQISVLYSNMPARLLQGHLQMNCCSAPRSESPMSQNPLQRRSGTIGVQ